MCIQKVSIETKFTKTFTLLAPGMINIIKYTTRKKSISNFNFFFYFLAQIDTERFGFPSKGHHLLFPIRLNFPRTAVQLSP